MSTIVRNIGDTCELHLAHVLEWRDCIKCGIGQIAKSRVLRRGTLPCQVLFVGEAPGDRKSVV